jgi:hypothetical protein
MLSLNLTCWCNDNDYNLIKTFTMLRKNQMNKIARKRHCYY